MTIGERIREYRKNCGLTQNKLAEKLGISAQSVSKWETGVTYPDITILVPLCSALGVSVDSILGEANANDEINSIYTKLWDKWKDGYNDQEKGRRWCDKALDYYTELSKLTKKYAADYELAMNCVFWAVEVLSSYKLKYFEEDEKEKNALFLEIEALATRVWKSAEKLDLKREAKKCLIIACCVMGYYGRAEIESESLGRGIDVLAAKVLIADNSPENDMQDYEEHLDAHRAKTSLMMYEVLWEYHRTLYRSARRGSARIDDTIREIEKFIKIVDANKGVFSEGHRLWLKMSTLKMLGTQYCARGDYDKALDVAESIGDAAQEYYRCYKEGEEECLLDYSKFHWSCFDPEYTDEKVKEELYWRTTFWDVFNNPENNPIVTSPRYKAVVDKIKNF